MAAYRVSFKKSALKELEAIPKKQRSRLLDAIQLLALNPFTELLPVKKLRGEDSLYRVRVQDYRLIYHVDGHQLTVLVVKLGHRKEVYD